MTKHLEILFLMASFSLSSCAQYAQEDWEEGEHQNAIITAKWSQLFYEVNIGRNARARHVEDNKANFVYFAGGFGKPSQKNAWRHWLPQQETPSERPEAGTATILSSDDLYAGKLGIGLTHYFNHIFGIYTQASWAFIADLGVPDEAVSGNTEEEKKTLIYNTVPVECGVCLNFAYHFAVQGGVTYMWKQIPYITLGVGFHF